MQRWVSCSHPAKLCHQAWATQGDHRGLLPCQVLHQEQWNTLRAAAAVISAPGGNSSLLMQDGVPTSQMHYSTKELRASAVCFHQTRELQQFPSAFRPTGPILAVCTELFFISRSSEAISYQATQSAPFPPKGFVSPLTINRLLAVRKEGRSGLLKCLLKGENRHNKRWRQVLKNISRHQFTKYVTKSFPAVPWQISPGYYFFFFFLH